MRSRLADGIDAARTDIGTTWWIGTRTGAEPLAERDSQAADASATSPESHAEALVSAFVAALRDAARWQDQAMLAGWGFGLLAHARGVPLYFGLEDLDTLAGMLLDRLSAQAGNGARRASGSETAAGAKRVHETASLLRLAAVKGYTQSVSDELRRRYRTIRHDLRNPLGTIKSALALMDDESIPPEMRNGSRYRALARKNATSLEGLIRTMLGDSAALLPAFAHEPVSLRAIAAGVRRDLRTETEARHIDIVIGDALPVVRTDSAGFELTLRSVVAAVMRGLEPHAEVIIDLARIGDRTASICVSACDADHDECPLDPEDLAIARELAARSGSRISRIGPGRFVCVDVPISGGEQPHDVRGTRERHHR